MFDSLDDDIGKKIEPDELIVLEYTYHPHETHPYEHESGKFVSPCNRVVEYISSDNIIGYDDEQSQRRQDHEPSVDLLHH